MPLKESESHRITWPDGSENGKAAGLFQSHANLPACASNTEAVSGHVQDRED